MAPALERHHIFPRLLLDVLADADDATLRQRSRDGGFCLVEHCWHVADLEEEAYAVRIDRLLRESWPALPDFAGDVVAEERQYIAREAYPAASRFLLARQSNLSRLSRLEREQWDRRGTQEGVGEVSLARVAAMMLEHDLAHANEIVALLQELDRPAPDELRAFAATTKP